ncbi:glycosyhydrolase [Treponema sp.]
MYSGRGFRDWEIGDIDVVRDRNLYHLFHLIIPNHDYIAHAVSSDGITWRRVKNALFVGEPGSWDDDMLWTMNIAKRNGKWHMFYTGLSRRDSGRIQRIGLALSDDLYSWEKIDRAPYPLECGPPWYEGADHNPRTWISFRDPYYFSHQGTEYLTFCGRTREGAIFRRGCAGLLKLGAKAAELMPPLHWPRVYDDVECPCIFQLGKSWFLVGSIREDVQVRYWVSSDPFGPYQAPSENVLFPKGNYATRVAYDQETLLLYSFFILGHDVSGTRVLPPPKQVAVNAEGRLYLQSFYRWNLLVQNTLKLQDMGTPRAVLANPSAEALWSESSASAGPSGLSFRASSKSGYEFFLWEAPSSHIRWRLDLTVLRFGKLGLIVNSDREGQGYFIVLDMLHGFAQIRSWSENIADVFQDYTFENLQANNFPLDKPLSIELIAYGNYLELSIASRIVLSLMNYSHDGRYFGIFSSSAEVHIANSTIETLREPGDEYSGEI